MTSTDKKWNHSPESAQDLHVRLYVAGDAPSSLWARANLRTLYKYFPENCSIDTVDILSDPLRALADGVLVSPTLLRVEPGPTVSIIGDLRDFSKVLDALGIDKGHQE